MIIEPPLMIKIDNPPPLYESHYKNYVRDNINCAYYFYISTLTAPPKESWALHEANLQSLISNLLDE